MATARPLCGGGCEPCCSRPAHNLLIQLVHLQFSSFRYVLFSKNALGLHCRLSGVGQSQKRRKKGEKKRGRGEGKEEYLNSALGGANNYTWPRAGRWALRRVEAAGGVPPRCSQPRPLGIRVGEETRTRHTYTQLPHHAGGCPDPSQQRRSPAAPLQREGDGDRWGQPPRAAQPGDSPRLPPASRMQPTDAADATAPQPGPSGTRRAGGAGHGAGSSPRSSNP